MVGRLVKDPEIKKTSNGNNYSYITLAIPRSYKTVDGQYMTDFINCTLWKLVATNTSEYCKKGDIVGVKGHIESRYHDSDDGKRTYYLEVVAEKVTFLSNNRNRNEED